MAVGSYLLKRKQMAQPSQVRSSINCAVTNVDAAPRRKGSTSTVITLTDDEDEPVSQTQTETSSPTKPLTIVIPAHVVSRTSTGNSATHVIQPNHNTSTNDNFTHDNDCITWDFGAAAPTTENVDTDVDMIDITSIMFEGGVSVQTPQKSNTGVNTKALGKSPQTAILLDDDSDSASSPPPDDDDEDEYFSHCC